MAPFLKEVTTKEELDRVTDCMWESYHVPYTPFINILFPVFANTDEGYSAAVAESKTRLWSHHVDDLTSKWVYVTDESGEVFSGAHWIFHEVSTYLNGAPTIDATWHPEGEGRKFASHVVNQVYGSRGQRLRRPHAQLDMMFTHPKQRRKGYGSMLMKWGMDRAEEMGLEVYVEASEEGSFLYYQFGLRTIDRLAIDTFVENPSNTWRRLESDFANFLMRLMWKPHGGIYQAGETELPWLVAMFTPLLPPAAIMATSRTDIQMRSHPGKQGARFPVKNADSDQSLGEILAVKTAISASKDLSHDADAVYLARMGKQQVLKRNFGLMSMVGLACTIMSTWEGILMSRQCSGGQAGLIYGFLYIWAGTMSVFIVMGELSSMIPTAGGQYHWVHVLAPKNYKGILSYVTGWLTCIGWMASVAAASLFCSTLIQALILENNGNFVPQGYQVTLIFWAAVFFSVFVNVFVNSALPKIEGLVLFVHVIGFFAVLIPLTYLGPKGDTKAIFTTFANGGGWPTQGLSFFIGLAGNAVAFIGADGAVHMSEEIKNPRKNVPRAMVVSIFINGLLALGILIAVLYTAGDLDAASNSPVGALNYPFVYIFAQATNSIGGASAMASIVVVIAFFSTTGSVAAASRQLWAFARDRGVPFHRAIGSINATTSVPLTAIAVVSTVPCLLALINIGSSAALAAVLSLVLAGLFTSYFIAAALLLNHRIKGTIALPNDDPTDISNPLEKLTWGPWRIKGVLGIANNIFACVYLVIITFF
ncbi:hypothetical protein G7Y89_g11196 [Cudoniella acicularis]|uniref:N-acetyltransferase domain-containing protein n=1 Tax=Cudoniella acicularis TaxID=354080 RepID=A0A8H4RBA7_9HELO|nr:hypothetical protein G7Y89_g11196 [Cudoniella acicularis]